MSAYLPRAGDALLAALAVLSAILALALLVTHIPRSRSARTAAWALVVLAVGAAHCVTSTQPAGLRMLVVIAALLFAMKAVVSVEARARDGTRLPLRRWLAFATLWPGMRAALFAHLRPGRPGAARLRSRRCCFSPRSACSFISARSIWWRDCGAGPAPMSLPFSAPLYGRQASASSGPGAGISPSPR